MGGHPTREARLLLPDHSVRLPDSWWWVELATHGASTWDYLLTAAQGTRYGYGDEVAAIAKEHGVGEAITSWRELDRLAYVAGGVVKSSTFRDLP